MDILQQDRREAAEQRQELCDIITKLQTELDSSEELRDKVTGHACCGCVDAELGVMLNCVCSWSRRVSSYG